MKMSWLAAVVALSFAACSQIAFAQITSNATGGAGGKGGSASGGSATGGSSSNSNTVNSSGGTGGSASGGTSSANGGSSSSQGGAANAQGGTVTGVSTGAINAAGTGNSQAAEVTVNYITPVAPGGIKGLAAGVDPNTNAYVNDNNIRYSGSQTIKNTPDVSVGGPASGPCNGFSGGVGVSVPGFAIGANASTVDKGCEARETARVAAMLGRMDIANAVLEHISVVEEALKAKAERDAAKQAALAAPAKPTRAAPEAPRQQQQQPTPEDMEAVTARLAEQQKLAVATIQRKVTMEKVNDTIAFTTAANQEKTPQQTMAEEAAQQQAELAARAEKQGLENQLMALKSAPATGPLNPLTPEVSQNTLAVAAPAATPATTTAQQANVASSPSQAAAASGAAAAPANAQQASVTDKPQPAKSSPAIDNTSGVPPMASSASVAGARPNAGGDQLNSVLGFPANAPSVSTASAAPSIAEDGTRKLASKAAVAPASKQDASIANKGSGGAVTKAPAPDPVSAAKALLNFK
jgi:hypothetical protein